MDNDSEMLPQVDAEGNVTGSMTRGHAHDGSKILHPVVHLHVFNSKGELYLQHRPHWKRIQPDKWDTACGGHIAFGESVDEALAREVGEELGISGFNPLLLQRYVFESHVERELVYLFRTVYDGEIKPSKDELSGGRFFTPDELHEAAINGEMTPNCLMELRTFLKLINV